MFLVSSQHSHPLWCAQSLGLLSFSASSKMIQPVNSFENQNYPFLFFAHSLRRGMLCFHVCWVALSLIKLKGYALPLLCAFPESKSESCWSQGTSCCPFPHFCTGCSTFTLSLYHSSDNRKISSTFVGIFSFLCAWALSWPRNWDRVCHRQIRTHSPVQGAVHSPRACRSQRTASVVRIF